MGKLLEFLMGPPASVSVAHCQPENFESNFFPTVFSILKRIVFDKNIARIANAVPVTLYSRVTVNVEIVVSQLSEM